MKSLHQLSSTHGITPLLEVFVPQLVSTVVKNMLTEEHSDFYRKPLLEIALELLKEIEFERGMVITIGRYCKCSVVAVRKIPSAIGIYSCTVESLFSQNSERKKK